MDKDLENLSQVELQQVVMNLRGGIRIHRDQKGDENCWLDDFSYLYGLLPEKIKSDPQLPPKQLMMINCSQYYDCRKAKKLYIPLDELPKKVKFAVDWIDIKERIPPFDTSVIVINVNEFKQCIAYNETYNELVMTRCDAGEEFRKDGTKIIYRQVPFEITHWYPLPYWPELESIIKGGSNDHERNDPKADCGDN